ncbi:MAG: SAM hydrolase/SAM-dependent halogenase family protein [Gemmatimonadaceae bacterium]
MRALVTLFTDFGTADGYVAELKGVLYELAPNADMVDLSHDVPPHDVEHARLAVARYWRRFPAGTVHLVVVDPGVGGERAALAVASDGRYLVGPDNGVLSPALLANDARAVRLDVPAHAAPTFHGRDVFAPAAASLAIGIPIDSLGSPFATPVIRRTPAALRGPDGSLLGEVIAIDRFGNLVTNLVTTGDHIVEFARRRLPLRHTYADVAPNTLVATVGSSGLVEIAMRDGDAAKTLGAEVGAPVTLRPV